MFASTGRVRLADFAGNAQEALSAQIEAVIARYRVLEAVTFIILADVDADRTAFRIILEQEVNDASNSIRPVLRRGTIPEDFDAFEGRSRNGGHVRALSSGSANCHECGAVAPFRVYQYKRLVGRQASHLSRANK